MTKNNFTTLVSCRIDNHAIKAIDKFIEGRTYLKRSSVINQALVRLFLEHDENEIYDFIYCKKPLNK